ncbi:MAG: V-type ATP synthase subunit A [Promethearchaeota archaeon]
MVDLNTKSNRGYISAIYGSLIEVKGLGNQTCLYDLIKIPDINILSEIIQIYEDRVIAQCFDNTNNLKLNEEVINLQQPLSMELAPGLVSHVFDGIQRPLEISFKKFKGGELKRGVTFQSLSRTKKWNFIPQKKLNDNIKGGEIIGVVQETPIIEHKILIPYNVSGKLSFIASEGDYTIIDEIYRVKKNGNEKSFSMLQRCPITIKRPYKKKINPTKPLLTGIRSIDLLFPVAKGGTFAIPGGFGTGKTVIQESIAKYCDADVVIFIGCGEPGNEIAYIMKEFSENFDSKTGRPLLDHIVLVVNTSNMPVSAREASLFSGVTIGEYYRDMGYDVAVIVDSISRWAEALREISSLLEEMPAEEGYPAYLPSKLSSFYERAGSILSYEHKPPNKDRIGSLTIIGSISPPAGDFNEPVTASIKRIVQGLWALDPKLAYLKHYPAIDWLNSYSNYSEYVLNWWREKDIKWMDIDIDWYECRKQINEILSKENDFKLAVQLTGEIELTENQKLELFMAKLIRNSFLIQNAFDKIDAFTDYKKLLALVKVILLFYKEGKALLKQGFKFEASKGNNVIQIIKDINYSIPNKDFDQIEKKKDQILKDSLELMFIS